MQFKQNIWFCSASPSLSGGSDICKAISSWARLMWYFKSFHSTKVCNACNELLTHCLIRGYTLQKLARSFSFCLSHTFFPWPFLTQNCGFHLQFSSQGCEQGSWWWHHSSSYGCTQQSHWMCAVAAGLSRQCLCSHCSRWHYYWLDRYYLGSLDDAEMGFVSEIGELLEDQS